MTPPKPRVCASCKNAQEYLGHPPRTLIRLATKTARNRVVYACPYCDGPAVELAKKRAKFQTEK